MATYKGIQGYSVQSLASDPGTLSEVVGQLWYNSTSNVWKIAVEGAGAWSSGNNLNTGRTNPSAGVMAPATAAITMGGSDSSPGNLNTIATVETYNGSVWATNPASLNTTRKAAAGIGESQTAAIVCGGKAGTPGTPAVNLANVELYNGSTWTEVNNILAAKTGLDPGSAGTSTAGLLYGGGPATDSNQSWDGTSWTEENDLNVAKKTMGKFGTQTAAVCAGGYSTTYLDTTEIWNGTSWTEVNDMNTTRSNCAGGGTTTAGIIWGGDQPGATANTETWDGTCWTEVANLATAVAYQGGGGGTSAITAALSWGGNPTYTNQTEEWAMGSAIKTFTSS